MQWCPAGERGARSIPPAALAAVSGYMCCTLAGDSLHMAPWLAGRVGLCGAEVSCAHARAGG